MSDPPPSALPPDPSLPPHPRPPVQPPLPHGSPVVPAKSASLPGWRIALGVVFAVLAVWIGLCPGEQVESIHVHTEDATGGDLSWTVEGTGSSQERWTVGGPLPDGYHVTEATPDLSGSTGHVWADVDTTDLYAYAGASQEDLAAEGVVIESGGSLVPREEFHDKSRSSYPCEDPYHENRDHLVAAIAGGIGVAFLVASLAIFGVIRRTRPNGQR